MGGSGGVRDAPLLLRMDGQTESKSKPATRKSKNQADTPITTEKRTIHTDGGSVKNYE